MRNVLKAALGLMGAALATQPASAVTIPTGDVIFDYRQTNNFGKPDVGSEGTLAVSSGRLATIGINVNQHSGFGVTLNLVGTGLDFIDFFAGRDGVTLEAVAQSGVTPSPGEFGGDCGGFPCSWFVNVSIPPNGKPTGTISFTNPAGDTSFVFNLTPAGYSGSFSTFAPLPGGETCEFIAGVPECQFAGSLTAVPEPAGLGILGLAMSGLLLVRARQRS